MAICSDEVLFYIPKTKKGVIIIEFAIERIETLKMTVNVEAETPEEALEEVERLYKDCEYILDSDHFVGVVFKLKRAE